VQLNADDCLLAADMPKAFLVKQKSRGLVDRSSEMHDAALRQAIATSRHELRTSAWNDAMDTSPSTIDGRESLARVEPVGELGDGCRVNFRYPNDDDQRHWGHVDTNGDRSQMQWMRPGNDELVSLKQGK